MWEVLFAPSVSARRLVAAAAACDRLLGRPLASGLERLEAGWQADAPMHEISLGAPEEDDYLLLHAWSALTIGLSSGLLDEARPYVFFDSALPPAERRRIMSFYRSCLARHLHADRRARGVGRRYLAKNPALAPKLDSVLETFPDAKIVVLVRNPLEMLPSYLSTMRYSWDVLGAPAEGSALADWLLEMAGHWYRYPLERLSREPEGSWIVVRYDDLVRAPDTTVRQIYSRLGLPLSEAFAAALREASAAARAFHSRHVYEREDPALSRERIVTALGDVFERFDFPTGDEVAAVPATSQNASCIRDH
jgi:hypothetical protein